MHDGLKNEGLPGLKKYGELTVREAGDIAESLGVSLLTLLRG